MPDKAGGRRVTTLERAKKELARMCEGTGLTGATGEPWRCLHHRELFEYATTWQYPDNADEPVLNRIVYVLKNKPEAEISVRLQEMKPWTLKLPKKLVQAHTAYDQARTALDQAYAAYDQAPSTIRAMKKAWPDLPWDYYRRRVVGT